MLGTCAALIPLNFEDEDETVNFEFVNEIFGGSIPSEHIQACENGFKDVMDKIGLSARAYDCILRVSRTIADMGGSELIRDEDLSEAIHYRGLDRSWTGMGCRKFTI